MACKSLMDIRYENAPNFLVAGVKNTLTIYLSCVYCDAIDKMSFNPVCIHTM